MTVSKTEMLNEIRKIVQSNDDDMLASFLMVNALTIVIGSMIETLPSDARGQILKEFNIKYAEDIKEK